MFIQVVLRLFESQFLDDSAGIDTNGHISALFFFRALVDIYNNGISGAERKLCAKALAALGARLNGLL